MKGRLDAETVLQVCQLLRSLVHGEAPLAESLVAVTAQVDDRAVAEALGELSNHLTAGLNLSQAMAASGEYGDDAVEAVRMGEQNGCLSEVLERYVRFLAADRRMKGVVRDAVCYPLVLSAALLLLVPLFARVLVSNQAVLESAIVGDGTMEALMGLWHLLAMLSPFCFVGAVVVMVSLATYAAGAPGWLFAQWESVALRLPWISRVQSSSATARLAWSLYVPLAAGRQLSEAFDDAARCDLPRPFRGLLEELAQRTRKGQSFATIIRDASCLPFTCRCMLAVAEGDNSLVPTLERLALMYEAEAQVLARTIPKRLSVAMVLAMSVVVGLAVVAMYATLLRLPLLQ